MQAARQVLTGIFLPQSRAGFLPSPCQHAVLWPSQSNGASSHHATRTPGAHPKAKFLNKAESQPPPGEKTHSKPAGIVTVQEEGAVMKEFSAIRGGDAHDHG